MKKIALLTILVASLALVPSALAWHADGVTVSASCDTSKGVYNVSASITQSQAYPNASIKTITPASFPGTTSGTQNVNVVIKWSNSNDTQSWDKTVLLDGKCKTPPPPDPQCPAGYTSAGLSNGVLLCTKETITERTVEVPGPTVTKTVEVAGPTQTVYVDKVVTVEKAVPGPTVTVIKWKTKVVNHKIVKVKIVYRTKYIHAAPKATAKTLKAPPFTG